MTSLLVICLALLVPSGLIGLPFERLITLEGSGGSKADFLDDEQVRELLLRHHMTVRMTRLGSRGAATSDLEALDFVFPSGQPAAEVVAQRRRAVGRTSSPHRPFVSPIVLATYREYAETLVAAGIATAQVSTGFDRPYYYDVDMAKFLDLTEKGMSWNALQAQSAASGKPLQARGVSNGNTVLAQTPDVCVANSAGTYLGLVAYLSSEGNVPTTEAAAAALAAKIKPKLRSQGLPLRAPEDLYFIPEGRQITPVVVFYEHQYLTHQLKQRQRFGDVDHDRVLLYPNTVFQTEPTFVALTPDAVELGRLLTDDPALRRRALELGFRVLDPSRANSSTELMDYLTEQRIPQPAPPTSFTRAVLPDVTNLETLITLVGDCR